MSGILNEAKGIQGWMGVALGSFLRRYSIDKLNDGKDNGTCNVQARGQINTCEIWVDISHSANYAKLYVETR